MPVNIDFQKAAKNTEGRPKWETDGQLRAGKQYGNAPRTLDTWRITVDSEELATAVANFYGGTVETWEPKGADRWEVITDQETIAVKVVSYKDEMLLWRGGGGPPVRACDGTNRTDNNDPGGPCKCAADYPVFRDRKTAAGQKEACTPQMEMVFELHDIKKDNGEPIVLKWVTQAWMFLEDWSIWTHEQATNNRVISLTKEKYQLKSGENRMKVTPALVDLTAAA
jgi:hypothetical protein